MMDRARDRRLVERVCRKNFNFNLLTIIVIFLFVAAVGKSAQPLGYQMVIPESGGYTVQPVPTPASHNIEAIDLFLLFSPIIVYIQSKFIDNGFF